MAVESNHRTSETGQIEAFRERCDNSTAVPAATSAVSPEQGMVVLPLTDIYVGFRRIIQESFVYFNHE